MKGYSDVADFLDDIDLFSKLKHSLETVLHKMSRDVSLVSNIKELDLTN